MAGEVFVPPVLGSGEDCFSFPASYNFYGNALNTDQSDGNNMKQTVKKCLKLQKLSHGFGTNRAAAASSNAKIFWAGLSKGQPKIQAWFKFSGTGLASIVSFCFLTSSAKISARPYNVAGRASAISCPAFQISGSESDLWRVTDRSGYG